MSVVPVVETFGFFNKTSNKRQSTANIDFINKEVFVVTLTN